MAVLRQSQAERIARDAVVLDLGDLSRQGQGILARAKADAEAILKQAAAERQKLLAGARDEGLAKGMEEGKKKGTEEGRRLGQEAGLAERREALAKLEAAWTAALEDFQRERERMLLDARQDVVRLAVMMGERIVKRTLELDASVVLAQIEAVLSQLAKPTKLTLTVAPTDEALAREAMPGLWARFPAAQHVDFRVDAAIAPGSCIAHTGSGGAIDATIPTQLDRMVAALMPGGSKGGSEERRDEGPTNSSDAPSPGASVPDSSSPPPSQGPAA
jgi:flagellar biosynthesis/type III secretory pathway protein FliH